MRPQVFFQPFQRIVRIDINRIVNLHLQNQVRPALEVEAQINALGDRRQQTRARPFLRNAEDAEHEDEQDSYDDH